MATKDKIDVEKARKEATKKVGFLLKELNKNLPGITKGSAAGVGTANSNLQAAISEKQSLDLLTFQGNLACKEGDLVRSH